jgi:hypothetical protein
MQHAQPGLSVERDDGSAAPPVYVIDLPQVGRKALHPQAM